MWPWTRPQPRAWLWRWPWHLETPAEVAAAAVAEVAVEVAAEVALEVAGGPLAVAAGCWPPVVHRAPLGSRRVAAVESAAGRQQGPLP